MTVHNPTRVRLRDVEVRRAEVTEAGRRYTVISRPGPNSRLVAVAFLDESTPGEGVVQEWLAGPVEGGLTIGQTIRGHLRWLDKAGGYGEMASSSRFRVGRKAAKVP